MSGGLVTAAYIVAAILFIFSLAGLSKHETSQQGNYYGIAGMAIALIATIFGPDTSNVAWILLAMIIGGAIGIRLAKKVEMTEMPELVAVLHSFVGLAAVLVGFNSYLQHETGMEQILVNIHLTEVFLGIFIGAVTFTGSVVAFGKLRGKISSRGESITTIVNFEEGRTYCKDIDRPAWGYIEYTAPLDPQQVSDYELVLAPEENGHE